MPADEYLNDEYLNREVKNMISEVYVIISKANSELYYILTKINVSNLDEIVSKLKKLIM